MYVWDKSFVHQKRIPYSNMPNKEITRSIGTGYKEYYYTVYNVVALWR